MRRLLVLALCCLPAVADWAETLREFRLAYRGAASAEERRTAIRKLAGADVREAAELLFELWDDLTKESLGLRRELTAGRDELRALKRKRREATSAGAKAKILNEILALEARDVARDKRLAGIELERYAILAGLRSMKSGGVLLWLESEGLRRARSPVLLRTVAERVAMVHAAPLLIFLGGERSPERVVPLLHAMARERAAPIRDTAPLVKLLAHNDWAVRVAAAQALAKAARPEGVGPVVAALQREKKRSRARLEMTRALSRLTGQKIGPYPELWQRWWSDHKDEVASGKLELGQGASEVASRREQGTFYGIPQDADRIIYVFDKSGSMEVSMQNPRWQGQAPVPAYDDEDSRFDAAVRELLKATRRLHRGSSFAVILYSNRAHKLHDKLVPATRDEKTKLANAMAREGPGGSTNIYEALDTALRMANVHALQTRCEQRADAIFLVSDGAPTNPKGEPEDPERTLMAVREWNAMKRIAIHCIGIGAQHNRLFLSRLAEENGGKYYAVLPRKKK